LHPRKDIGGSVDHEDGGFFDNCLTRSKSNRTPEEYRLTELLTLLIEDFEAKHYSLQPATPLDILRHLMESNGLRQVDLIGVFGTASIASEVLSGKRALAKSHIEKLSQRFNVSSELFFDGRAQAKVASQNKISVLKCSGVA